MCDAAAASMGVALERRAAAAFAEWLKISAAA
jgi:hypothetical protein